MWASRRRPENSSSSQPDLFVARGYLDELVSFFEEAPTAARTGKILRYELEGPRPTSSIRPARDRTQQARRRPGREPEGRPQYEREEEVFGVSGAALVARREALESVKVCDEYLDESFDMYKEDIDLCWRLRPAGWLVPAQRAYHARTSHGLARRTYLSSPAHSMRTNSASHGTCA